MAELVRAAGKGGTSGGGRPGAFSLLPLLALLFLMTAAARPLGAQTVVGQLLDREGGGPVEGALALLLDSEGRGRGGALTNAAGRFLIRAPEAGRYSVRIERIGYETVSSEPFDLAPNTALGIRLETGMSAIQMDEIRVEGEQQCVVRPEEGLEVARVWDEARKALAVQAWTEGEKFYRFRVVRYERELDEVARVVRSETREVSEGASQNPVRSLPVEDLLEQGFVQRAEDGGWYYYGPDASVLLSDPFLDTHCFRLVSSSESSGSIGLAFEPVQHRSIPDIEGTLWLDRESAKLQSLDFTYDWAPWEEARSVARGRVEFQEMANGAWIIRRWWIQMPIMAQNLRRFLATQSSLYVEGIKEVGGEVSRVDLPRAEAGTDPLPLRGLVMGTVWDSLSQAPLAGVTVFLSGTSFAARSDPQGGFLLEEVPEGTYRLAVTYPFLDSLGVFPPGPEVSVAPGEVSEVEVGLPSRETLRAAVCSGSDPAEGEGVVTGIVRRKGTGAPMAGVQVTLEWRSWTIPGGREVHETTHRLQVPTDNTGRYRACGIPPGALVRASAALYDESGAVEEFQMGRDQIRVQDLILAVGRPIL